MKVLWLIDGEGHNPEFSPPDKNKDPVGYQLYRVRNSDTVCIPAGTIEGFGCEIGNADCWNLCCPDGSGNRKEKVPGLIYCEPFDDDAREMVQAHYEGLSVENRRWFDLAKKRTAVHRKEQIAAAAKAKAEGKKALPIHPWLTAASFRPEDVPESLRETVAAVDEVATAEKHAAEDPPPVVLDI
jgi:hypothetical protein